MLIGGKRFEAGMSDPQVPIEVIPLEYPCDEHDEIVAKNNSEGNYKKTAKIKLTVCPPLSYSELIEDVKRRKQAKGGHRQKWQEIIAWCFKPFKSVF